MVSKKQKVRTVILVLLLAIAIVGGVFAISYYKGGVTFPWQVTAGTETKEEVAEEPQDEKLTVTVVEPEAKEETKKKL